MRLQNIIHIIFSLISFEIAYFLNYSGNKLSAITVLILTLGYLFFNYLKNKKDEMVDLLFNPLSLNIDWFLVLIFFSQLISYIMLDGLPIKKILILKIALISSFVVLIIDIFNDVKYLKNFLIDINQKLEEKLIEINNFQVISKALNSILDLEKLLKIILDIATGLLKVESMSLFLLNTETGFLEPRVYNGIPDEIAKKLKIKVGDGIIGYVAKTGENLLIKDISKDERFKKENPRKSSKYKTDSLVCVPLNIKEEIIGVLSINNKINGDSFDETDLEMASVFASQAAIAIENANLYENMHKSYISTVRALSAAIDAKDKYTSGHSNAVTAYTIPIAQELGIEKEELGKLEYAGLLHDIGKIGIMEQILNKPGRLTNEEFGIIKKHPVIGFEILKSIDFLKDVTLLVKFHHERWDGKGYPDGLKETAIPLGARIIAVADTFDAMTSDRPYRKGLPVEVAIDEIKRCSGSQFDPTIVDAFIRAYEKGKINLHENKGEIEKLADVTV